MRKAERVLIPPLQLYINILMELILSLPCYSHGQPLAKWVFPAMGILRYTKDQHWTTKKLVGGLEHLLFSIIKKG